VNVGRGDLVAIDRENDPTQIYGRLNCAGTCHVLDRDGIIVGAEGVIDAVNVTLGTGDLVDANRFMESGDVVLSNFGTGKIINEGTISVSEAGVAAFVSPFASNAGIINAKLGKVVFAAGEKVTLDLYGDGLVEIAVEGKLEDALLENSGAINAEGGTVQMTAMAAKEAVDNIINVDGVVTVASAIQKGGKIILSGGDQGAVAVSGKLDAQGTTGGDIEVTGQYVQALDGAEIDASGVNGGGTIHFGWEYLGGGETPTSEYAYVAQQAILRANAKENGDGGEVIVWSDIATGFYGAIEAKSGVNGGNGGFVETSGKEYLEAFGSVDASAANGLAGEWLLDPRNLTVTNSTTLNISTSGGNPNIITAINTNSGNTSYVTDNTIEASLNNGTSVTLRTGGQDDGDGDITVDAQIDKTAGGIATLRLEAHDDIIINQNIVSTVGQLAVQLIAEAFGGTLGDQYVQVNADIITNGGAFLADGEFIQINTGAVITTNGGAVTLTAADDIFIDEDVTTNGGKATFTAGGTFTVDNADDLISTNGGTITVVADAFGLGGALNAGSNGKIILGRDSDGQIDVGDSNGSAYLISQDELNRMAAQTLEIGIANGGTDNNIRVQDADASAFNTVILSTKTPSGGNDEAVRFTGVNVVNNLIVNADDTISFDANSRLTSTGDLTFNANLNKASTGVFSLGTNALIDSNGKNVTINAYGTNAMRSIWLLDSSEINAEGGNITINNEGYFAGAADSLTTKGAGTITLNQYNSSNGFSTGTLQNAINALNNTGTGLNTINAYVGSKGNAYVENITIAENNLKLNGIAAVELHAASAGNLISVTGDNVNIDPFVFDGLGIANFGVYADGADNLVVDGNTFKNFVGDAINSGYGVFVTNGNNADIKNNTFLTNASGIRVNGGIDHTVTNNTIDNGRFGVVLTFTGNNNSVSGNTIGQTAGTSDNSIYVFANSGDTTVSGNFIYNSGFDGVNVSGGGTGFVTVQNNEITNTLGASGIAFIGHNGDGLVDGNKIDGADRLGIYIGNTDGLLIEENIINNTGREAGWWTAGIHLEGADNTTVNVNTISNSGGDGIKLGGVGNFAAQATTGNKITGNVIYDTGADGIDVSNSAGVEISGNLVGFKETVTPDIYATAGAFNINGDGILVNASNNALIRANFVTDTTSTGFDIGSGIHVKNSNDVIIGEDDAGVDDSDDEENYVLNSAWDGIKITGGSNVSVIENYLNTIARVGIYAGNVNGALIEKNTLVNGNTSLAGYGAISSDGGSNLVITANDIDGSVSHGIRVFNAGGQNKINRNLIDTVSGNGVYVSNSDVTELANLEIKDNLIGYGIDKLLGTDDTIIGANGIEVVDSDYSNIAGNKITGTVLNGIFIDPSNNAIVSGNTINNAGTNGIYSLNNNDITIKSNTVSGSGQDGILVSGGKVATIGGDLLADRNTITNSAEDGIDVRDIEGLVTVKNNKIDTTGNNPSYYGGDGTGHNGIEARNLTGAIIDANDIDNAGNNGIEIVNNTDSKITFNTIDNSGFDGMSTESGSGLLIDNNTIKGTINASGIAVHSTTNATVSNNIISDTNLLGIYGQTTDGIQILDNKVTNAGVGVGVGHQYGTGIGVETAEGVTITGNTVTTAKSNGISVGVTINNGDAASTNVTVDNNVVSGTGINGIIVLGGALSVSDNWGLAILRIRLMMPEQPITLARMVFMSRIHPKLKLMVTISSTRSVTGSFLTRAMAQ
jgi:parallel beta-helix repeat protein